MHYISCYAALLAAMPPKASGSYCISHPGSICCSSYIVSSNDVGAVGHTQGSCSSCGMVPVCCNGMPYTTSHGPEMNPLQLVQTLYQTLASVLCLGWRLTTGLLVHNRQLTLVQADPRSGRHCLPCSAMLHWTWDFLIAVGLRG